MKLIHVVTAAALATVLSTTAAEAQTTLYGCYVKNSGTVYRIKAPNTPTKCTGNSTEFSWNMEGQVGPQGPQGPQGPAGTSGWPGVELRTREQTVVAGGMVDMTAFCLSDEVLLSGGHDAGGLVTEFLLLSSMPKYLDNGENSRWGWGVKLKNTMAGNPIHVTAYAYCRLAIN